MVKEKLTFRKILERFSYGCGDFGCNIIYTAMSVYLMFYYTDYAGVSSASNWYRQLLSVCPRWASPIIAFRNWSYWNQRWPRNESTPRPVLAPKSYL